MSARQIATRGLVLAAAILTAAPALVAAEGPARLVRDIDRGTEDRDPAIECCWKSGEWIYFVGDDPANGRELWRTDGTPEGTAIVREHVRLTAGSPPKVPSDETPVWSIRSAAPG